MAHITYHFKTSELPGNPKRKTALLIRVHPDLLELISIYGILRLQRKEAIAMGTLQFADVQTRPTEVLDLTSLTVKEFQELVPPFEAAFQAHMIHWRFDGKPRTARRYTTYTNCPLPTPEDRLLFILVYLKTYPLQVVQGRLFGMGQSKAHQWIHVLLVVLRATLRALGDAPTRSLPTTGQETLADCLREHIGVLHSTEYFPGGARMSEASGKKFTAGLVAKRQQGRQ
ncbi:MAG: transposase family protein [Deltaproteobacteria bacterium]|nr:transposase family protein [Deltaproteobacteria bacterium]